MSKLLSHGKAVLTAALCSALAACQTTSGMYSTNMNRLQDDEDRAFCVERPVVCALIGAVVIGGVVAIASSGGDGDSDLPGTGGAAALNLSDVRLKTDVQFVEQLGNGVNLYAFRYIGDDRVFVGVDAAEIQGDPRHAHAVGALGGGFLGVNYQALNLVTVNEAEMRAAGMAALATASAL